MADLIAIHHINCGGGWYFGYNESTMKAGPFDSEEKVTRAGYNDHPEGGFFIVEAVLTPWHAPDADSVIEQWIDSHEELWHEDQEFPGFDDDDQTNNMRRDLQSLLNCWLEKHKSNLPTPTSFIKTQNMKYIPVNTKTVINSGGKS